MAKKTSKTTTKKPGAPRRSNVATKPRPAPGKSATKTAAPKPGKPAPAAKKKIINASVDRKPPKKKRSRTLNHREIQTALIRLRERISEQIDFLATENLNRTRNDDEFSFRSEEQGTDNYERDMALTRVSSEQDLVFEIDEALNRLAMGIYGQCEGCGCSIEPERMVALPYSRMCVACQSRTEIERKRQRPPDNKAFFNAADKGLMESTGDND